MKIKLLVGLVTHLILLSACSVSDEQAQDIEEKCKHESIQDISRLDDLSEECRLAIEAILPATSNDLYGSLHVLAASDGGTELYIAGLADNGQALEFTDELIIVEKDDSDRELTDEEFTVTAVSEMNSPISLALVQDYSGSMQKSDIEVASELYTDLVVNLSGLHQTSYNVFSEQSQQLLPFTDDIDSIKESIAFNESIDRKSTALYDGMAEALADLKTQSSPIKIAIVSTDGGENSSEDNMKADVLSLNSDGSVFTLMLGSFFADSAEMKDLHNKRGAYIYAPKIKALKDRALVFRKMIEKSVKITLPSSDKKYEIKVGGKSLSWNES